MIFLETSERKLTHADKPFSKCFWKYIIFKHLLKYEQLIQHVLPQALQHSPNPPGVKEGYFLWGPKKLSNMATMIGQAVSVQVCLTLKLCPMPTVPSSLDMVEGIFGDWEVLSGSQRLHPQGTDRHQKGWGRPIRMVIERWPWSVKKESRLFKKNYSNIYWVSTMCLLQC